jgi:hypothetical protein
MAAARSAGVKAFSATGTALGTGGGDENGGWMGRATRAARLLAAVAAVIPGAPSRQQLLAEAVYGFTCRAPASASVQPAGGIDAIPAMMVGAATVDANDDDEEEAENLVAFV